MPTNDIFTYKFKSDSERIRDIEKYRKRENTEGDYLDFITQLMVLLVAVFTLSIIASFCILFVHFDRGKKLVR